MTAPTYPAARLVADSVQGHFARHIASARAQDAVAGDTPSPLAIETIIDAAFWASLRREEGQAPKISLAFLPPEHARHSLVFGSRLPLAPSVLSKVAPAVERPGIHLGVWCEGHDFFVWGTTREVPAFCLVVEVVASGLIVVKHRSEPFGKFVNVAVLEGDQIKIVDEGVGRLIPDCPDLVASLTGAIDHRFASGVTAVLIQLAASMRQHGRGGACWSSRREPRAGVTRSSRRCSTRSIRRTPNSQNWSARRMPIRTISSARSMRSPASPRSMARPSSTTATTCWRSAQRLHAGAAAPRSSTST